MKKVLTIILASLLNIQNTRVMASDAFEGVGDNNIVSTKASTKTLEERDKINEILPYLPLKEIVRDRLVSKDWNAWIQQSIKHLIPHATWEDIQSFLKSPELKIPFYYAPKNARRNIDRFFRDPGSWEMMLPLLKNKKHAVQDQQLCLEEGLGSTTQRVTPILEMFFNKEHTREEKQKFIQNSLLNPEVITFLGKTPELMDQIKIEETTRNIIMERFHFLETLRAMAPRDIYDNLRDQSNIPFKALGFLFVAMNKNVDYTQRMNAAKTLAGLGEEYEPQETEAYLSIATDTKVDHRNRERAAEIIAGWGENYKPLAAEAYLSIATDTDVYSADRLEAAEILAGWGEDYKPEAAEAYLSIATDTRAYYSDRTCAVESLLEWGKEYEPLAVEVYLDITTDTAVNAEDRISAARNAIFFREKYKPQVAEICLSIATETSAENYNLYYYRIDDRIDAAKALAGWGEEYKPQAAQACRSILETPGISEERRRKVEEMLRAFGEDE